MASWDWLHVNRAQERVQKETIVAMVECNERRFAAKKCKKLGGTDNNLVRFSARMEVYGRFMFAFQRQQEGLQGGEEEVRWEKQEVEKAYTARLCATPPPAGLPDLLPEEVPC